MPYGGEMYGCRVVMKVLGEMVVKVVLEKVEHG